MGWKSADGDKDAGEAKAGGAANDEAEAPAKGGRSLISKKLVILLVAGLVLAGGGIGAVKMLGGGGGDEGEKKKDTKVVAPLTWQFNDLMVNIDDEQGWRVLRCVAYLEVDNPKALDELRLREVVFRDALMEILRSKTLKDLEYPGENAIKREMRDRLNRMMTKGSIVEVYFAEFLIH